MKLKKNQWKYEKAMEKKDAVFAAGTDEFKVLIRKLNQLQIAKDFGEEYDKIERKLYEKFEEQYLEYDNALFEARLYRDSESLSDVLKYQMTAGEIEARDVENRSSLNVEERRKRFPTRKTENGVIFSENKENPFEYKEMSYQDRFDNEFFELFAEDNTVEKESKVLGDDLVRLADVIRMPGKKIYSDKLVSKVARYLCTEYNSDYNKETLSKEIAKIYEYIAGTEDLQWNDVMNVCYELAGKVLKEQRGKKIVNDYAKMILKDIRSNAGSSAKCIFPRSVQ